MRRSKLGPCRGRSSSPRSRRRYLTRSGGLELSGGDAGAAPPAAARHRPCPFRWRRSSRKRSRSISTIRHGPRRSATSRFRPRSPAICRQQAGSDGADVKAGDLLYRIDATRLSGRARSGEGAGRSATKRRSTISACQSRRAATSSPRAAIWPRTASTSARAPCARRKRTCHVARRRAHRRAQPGLHRNPRALCRAARAQPGAGGNAGQHTAGTPLNTLVQLSPIYVTFNPSETRSRRHPEGPREGQSRGRSIVCRAATRNRATRRPQLHRQRGRAQHRHDRGARHDRQCRSDPAARPVRPRPPACQANSRTR